MSDLNLRPEDEQAETDEGLNFEPIESIETLDDLEAELQAEAEQIEFEETAEEREELEQEEKQARQNAAENQAQLMQVVGEISGVVKELSDSYYVPKGAKGYSDEEALKLTASGMNVVRYFFPVDRVDPRWVALGTFAAVAWSLHKARMPDMKVYKEKSTMRDVSPENNGPEI